jgi:probable rRNA maturation factor
VAGACFEAEGIEGAGFGIRIVDGAAIRILNRDMRGVDQETDVLSFPTVDYPGGKTARDCPRRLKREYDPYPGYVNLGDCAINLDRASAQAAEYGHSLKRELSYLTAHSAFHLMGYDHMSEEEKNAWSVIGSICGTNWDTDFPMTEVEPGVFQSEVLELKAGDELKCRQGASWDVTFPAENVVVEADGSYIVQLTIDGDAGTVELIAQ